VRIYNFRFGLIRHWDSFAFDLWLWGNFIGLGRFAGSESGFSKDVHDLHDLENESFFIRRSKDHTAITYMHAANNANQ
jgi:hypothetical protein